MKIFVPNDAINEATAYYIHLIEKSVIRSGSTCIRVTSVADIKDGDHVITIRAGDLRFLYMRRRNLKLANWFQGIGPEEYALLHPASVKSHLIQVFLNLQERLALSKSSFNLMVSNEMLRHFSKKYNTKINILTEIMPCYNKAINISAFNFEKKYTMPQFVYAGGLFAWQAIDRTLRIYKMIENELPDASLTILTREIDVAETLLQRYEIERGIVKFVELENLEQELKQYKYGFLIREDVIVNQVSTPTKMNTYLSCGIMPIYTDVVVSFEENIDIFPYCVKVGSYDSDTLIAHKIIEHSNFRIDPFMILQKYKELFDRYYLDELYIEKISKMITNCGLY